MSHPYYLTRDELSGIWTDDVLAPACDHTCGFQRLQAIVVLARVEPLRRDDVLAIVRSFRETNAGAADWQALCRSLSVARSAEEAATRRQFLIEIDLLGEHKGGPAIAAALAELNQYWPGHDRPDAAAPSPP